MVSTELVVAWEDAYRKYGGAAGPNIIDTSHAVASAWLGLLGRNELPWWLSAAVWSAAAAFERQAQAWQTCAVREAHSVPPPRQVVSVEMLDERSTPSIHVPKARVGDEPYDEHRLALAHEREPAPWQTDGCVARSSPTWT